MRQLRIMRGNLSHAGYHDGDWTRSVIALAPVADHVPNLSSDERGATMQIVEKKVSAGDREIFDLEEFLSRPLYAHLAHNSESGARESPVWFHWDGTAIWIIGGTTFPANLKRHPRCALGIVDWQPTTGRSQHVDS